MEPAKHLMLVPVNMWGHARPLCILASRIVKLRPKTSVTVFIGVKFADRAKAEVVRDFLPDEEHLLEQISFVTLEQGDHPIDASLYAASFLDAWNMLQSGHALSSHTANGTHRSVDLSSAPLSAAIIDMFMVGAFRTLQASVLREQAETPFGLYSWLPAATNCMPFWFGDDRVPQAEELATSRGISFNDAAHEARRATNGKIVRSPYLPPVYDHECRPQSVPVSTEFCGDVLIRVAGVFRDTDGVITFDAAEYHPEATAALRASFAETSRNVVYAGPLVSGGGSPGKSKSESDVRTFLGAQLGSRGERSVILISFGSMFWPSDPAKLGAVLEVLMDKNIPFVLSCCSPFAAIPDDTRRKLEEYDSAFLSNWIPQQAVLAHPATGWCLTHAGHNSVLECILAGVPMILWPIDADQPANAIHLTEQLKVGYELLEVRHGVGLGPILRTGRTLTGSLEAVRAELLDVLQRAFGADGEAKRVRLAGLREKLQDVWEEGGVARREVEAFLDAF
ncbi:UDP-Glycosyltransferase/glycogen phosphorylase [Pilatotrama ljubarskyi]|nr:UDP-Glycosyltransferase/glycogen phosphorylase [Pilatotrama ljubarskyi]